MSPRGGSRMPGSPVSQASINPFTENVYFVPDATYSFGSTDGSAGDGRPVNIFVGQDAIGTTVTDGIIMLNATTGSMQYSPTIRLGGYDASGESSFTSQWRIYSGPSAGMGRLVFDSYEGAAWANRAFVTSTGGVQTTNLLAASGAMGLADAGGDSGSGLVLRNSSAATVSIRQYSPGIFQAGQAWETTGGTSQEVIFLHEVQTQSAATATANLVERVSINGGGYSTLSSLSSAGVLSLPAVTGGLSISAAKAIGLTPTEARSIVLRNSTAAAVGAVQYSPSVYFAGQTWETTGGTSQEVIFRLECRPVQTTTAAGSLVISTSLNGGAYVALFDFSSLGSMTMMRSSAAHITWNTDGGGNVGYSATLLRPDNVFAKTLVVSAGLRATGASSGAASTTTFTNATAAADTNVPTFINTPTGIAAAQATWMQVYIGTVASYIPVWQ